MIVLREIAKEQGVLNTRNWFKNRRSRVGSDMIEFYI